MEKRMPIQFRCPACDRMLGIARRKAGTVVKCPRCNAEVRVPALAGMAVETSGPVGAAPAIPKGSVNGNAATVRNRPSAAERKVDSMPLFERPDFEALLNPALEGARPRAEPTEPPPAAAPLPRARRREEEIEEAIDVEALPDGYMLTRTQLTVAAAVIAVLMGMAFAAGYFLAPGRSSPPVEKHSTIMICGDAAQPS